MVVNSKSHKKSGYILSRLLKILFYVFFAVMAVFVFRHILAEVPLQIASEFLADDCNDSRYEGKSAASILIQDYINDSCAVLDQKFIDVYLVEVIPFEWDSMVVVSPYGMKLSTVSKVGFNANVLVCTKSDVFDEWTQLVFLLDDDVVNYFDISSYLFSFGYTTRYTINKAIISASCV